jgi:hypothetical protein
MFVEANGAKFDYRKGIEKITKIRTNPLSGWVDVRYQTQ